MSVRENSNKTRKKYCRTRPREKTLYFSCCRNAKAHFQHVNVFFFLSVGIKLFSPCKCETKNMSCIHTHARISSYDSRNIAWACIVSKQHSYFHTQMPKCFMLILRAIQIASSTASTSIRFFCFHLSCIVIVAAFLA